MLIVKIDEDRFIFDVPNVLRQVVVDLARQLDGELDSDSPSLQRLFPTAYSDDPEKDAGYQILARGELVDARRMTLDAVVNTADADEIDGATLDAWMRVVNDLRLVFGTVLEVSEADDWEPAEDQESQYQVYEWLGVLLTYIVEAQLG